jgi:hypothetical protein
MINLDPDIKKILRNAGVDPDKATDEQIALADRLIQLHTTAQGVLDHRGAGEALFRRIWGSR